MWVNRNREGFNDGMTGATLQVGEAAPALLQWRSDWKVQPEPVGRLVPPKLPKCPTLHFGLVKRQAG